MALVKTTIKRLDHPTENGAWFVVRTPLMAGDLEGLTSSGDNRITVSFELMGSVIQEWSYEEPISVEALRTLDIDTYNWLVHSIFRVSGIQTDLEKKGSGSSSPVASAPDAEPSLVNSGI